jgi:hypothetical protein
MKLTGSEHSRWRPSQLILVLGGHRAILMARRSKRLVLAVGIAGALALGYGACWQGVVVRRAHAASDSPYRAELCGPRAADVPPERVWSDPAPGSGYVGSPDSRYLAFTREAARAYHTIYVWNEPHRVLRSVVSVREGDPGSGQSHDYRWSRDSKALLISGWGALPLQSPELNLAYVYVVAEDTLYKVHACS